MTSFGQDPDSSLEEFLASSERSQLDDVVDGLLRDKDFLLTREIKHRIDELNRLFAQASSQNLRVELETTVHRPTENTRVTVLDVTVLKEI